MREMLKGGLQWFCTERKEKGNFILKLEARWVCTKMMLGCKKDVDRDWVKLYGYMFTFFL